MIPFDGGYLVVIPLLDSWQVSAVWRSHGESPVVAHAMHIMRAIARRTIDRIRRHCLRPLQPPDASWPGGLT